MTRKRPVDPRYSLDPANVTAACERLEQHRPAITPARVAFNYARLSSARSAERIFWRAVEAECMRRAARRGA